MHPLFCKLHRGMALDHKALRGIEELYKDGRLGIGGTEKHFSLLRQEIAKAYAILRDGNSLSCLGHIGIEGLNGGGQPFLGISSIRWMRLSQKAIDARAADIGTSHAIFLEFNDHYFIQSCSGSLERLKP